MGSLPGRDRKGLWDARPAQDRRQDGRIRVRSHARRSFALPLLRQPSRSGRRNTRRAWRSST